ncbi:MAG: DUF1385 domain-containing protein [Candidatus Woesearchaeota archaeon]|nr:DUF1385 domain-containing protein [Candidatus Woesearchaeota archaeon]
MAQQPELITAGGQAVIEGVLIRSSNKMAIAVRAPNKKIILKIERVVPYTKRHRLLGLPVVRGVATMAEMLITGVRALHHSANIALGEEEELTVWNMALSLVFSFGLVILLFKVVPLLIAQLMTTLFVAVKNNYLLFNLIDGGMRIIIFMVYLYSISFMADVKRLFMYHGAEHKAVHCYEHFKGNLKKLTVANVQKHPPEHPRCGTSFIIIVLIISVLMYSFIPKTVSFAAKLGLRLLLLPLVAGLSYEILKFSAKHLDHPLMRIVTWPGLLMQKITTKEPTNDMVEVAIKALKAAV